MYAITTIVLIQFEIIVKPKVQIQSLVYLKRVAQVPGLAGWIWSVKILKYVKTLQSVETLQSVQTLLICQDTPICKDMSQDT